jgi:hypothetical protein
VRQVLEEAGVGVELRLALSIMVGVAVYVPCLTLVARDIATQLLQMARGLRPVPRPGG